MNGAHSASARARLWGRTGPWIIGLAVVWITAPGRPVWGQSAVWQPQNATTGNIYYTGGNVGIGTNSPATTLHVFGQAPAIRVDSVSGGAYLDVKSDVGWNGLRLLSGQTLFWQLGQEGGSDFYFYRGTSSGNVLIPAGNVGIGTTSPTQKLSVNGTILAKEVIVQSGWADYVFDPGYTLKPLSEVGAYIAAHRRLPDMPSAAEVQEKGVGLGEIQAKLLAKVEELTLHMVRMEERDQRLEQENRELRDRLARLERNGAAER